MQLRINQSLPSHRSSDLDWLGDVRNAFLILVTGSGALIVGEFKIIDNRPVPISS